MSKYALRLGDRAVHAGAGGAGRSVHRQRSARPAAPTLPLTLPLPLALALAPALALTLTPNQAPALPLFVATDNAALKVGLGSG